MVDQTRLWTALLLIGGPLLVPFLARRAIASSTVLAPNVVGLTETQARAALQAAGLTMTVDGRPANDAPAGTVLAQSPTAGSSVAVGTTVGVLVSAGVAPPPPPPPPGALSLIFFGHPAVYSQMAAFLPYLTSDDVLFIRAHVYDSRDGGDAYTIDEAIAWAQQFRAQHPTVRLAARANGLAAHQTVADALRTRVPGLFEGLVYGYEYSGFTSVPEYTDDTAGTYLNFQRAYDHARTKGFRLYGMPTGKPVFNISGLTWDMGELAKRCSVLVPQLQGYLNDEFTGDNTTLWSGAGGACARVAGQMVKAGGVPWLPQLTITNCTFTGGVWVCGLQNGAPWDFCAAKTPEATSRGAQGVTIQWTTDQESNVIRYIQAVR